MKKLLLIFLSLIAIGANGQYNGLNLSKVGGTAIVAGNTSAANSLPVTINTEEVTGTITTQNLVPAGTATAGSAVEIELKGSSGLSIQVTGTYTGALTVQFTLNGTAWVNATMFLVNTNIGGAGTNISSGAQSIYTIGVHEIYKVRVTALAAVTGTATVTLRANNGSPSFFLSAPIPTGSNTIGAVNIAASQTLATVTTVGTVTTLANGQTAHSSASSGSPLRVGARVLPANPDNSLVAGDASDIGITTDQQVVVKQNSTPERDFTFNGTIGNSTTAVVFKAAAGASVRNYLKGLILNHDALGAASELVIKDGAITFSSQTIASNIITSAAAHDLKIGDQFVASASTITGLTAGTVYWVLTVPSTTTLTLSATPNGSTLAISGTGVTATANRILYRTKLQTTALVPTEITFEEPLRGTPNTTMDIQTISNTTSGTVYYHVQGYIGF